MKTKHLNHLIFIGFLIAAMIACFCSCSKEDDPQPKQQQQNQSTSYTKPDAGTEWETFQTLYYKLDSSDVYCEEETISNTTGFIVEVINDSLLELKNHLGSTIGGCAFEFNTSTGEIVLQDGVPPLTAPYNGQPGYLENTKLFYNNEKIPSDSSVVVVNDSEDRIYMNDVAGNVTLDCGHTVYVQNRLRKK